jgi:hypothetical protein
MYTERDAPSLYLLKMAEQYEGRKWRVHQMMQSIQLTVIWSQWEWTLHCLGAVVIAYFSSQIHLIQTWDFCKLCSSFWVELYKFEINLSDISSLSTCSEDHKYNHDADHAFSMPESEDAPLLCPHGQNLARIIFPSIY